MGTDTLTGIAVGLVLFFLTLPIASRLARREGDDRLRAIVAWGLALKLLAAPAQLFVTSRFYQDIADFNIYHDAGATLAAQFRHGIFAADVGRVVGSGFVSILTGIVYAIIGVSKLGGFFVFSWMGFLGVYFFYRAFRVALPDADHIRYAKLVFFLPSILFWSSAIGKDAWMCLCLGVTALGAARILTRNRFGFVPLALGLTGAAMVRPHVALIFFAAAAVAYLIRRVPARSMFSPFFRIAGVAVLAVASVVLVHQVEHFFGTDTLNSDSVDHVLALNSRLTQGHLYGGVNETTGFSSSFDPTGLRSPAGFPAAVATILFRPFPFEAHGTPALVASMEGSLLLFLTVTSLRRMRSIFRMARQHAYVSLCALYSIIFIYLFASIGNFGIIARQRVQLLPLYLVLLALPVWERPRDEFDPFSNRVTSAA